MREIAAYVLGQLRDAAWAEPRRLTAYAWILLAVYAAMLGYVWLTANGLIDYARRPVGTDFVNVYAAGELVRQGEPAAAYNYARHRAAEVTALGGEFEGYYGWHYPPPFLLVAAALAGLPYLWALGTWLLGTFAAYCIVLRRLLPRAQTLLFSAAFPAVFVNLGHGQNGFFTAALFGAALHILWSRPFLAGCLIGLLTYKPQFGILIPFALLAIGAWRAIAGAVTSTLIVAGASLLAFGSSTWRAFIESVSLTTELTLEQGAAGFFKLQSTFAAVRLLGFSASEAHVAQIVVMLGALATVVCVWRRNVAPEAKCAVLAIGCLLAPPYVYDYDFVLLALPIVWMVRLAERSGYLPYEKTLLIALAVLPLVARPLAMELSIAITPALLVAALVVFARGAWTRSTGQITDPLPGRVRPI